MVCLVVLMILRMLKSRLLIRFMMLNIYTATSASIRMRFALYISLSYCVIAMAALVAARTEINVKRTTAATTVPDDPIAKLMYYLNCVFSCVDIGNDPSLNRLRNYSNYTSLSTDEKAQVVSLCLVLSPDKLTGVIFFRNETL